MTPDPLDFASAIPQGSLSPGGLSARQSIEVPSLDDLLAAAAEPTHDISGHQDWRTMSATTLKAYRSDWKIFTNWCADPLRLYVALPTAPMTVAMFLVDMAERGTSRSRGVGLSLASIERRLSAIVFAHRVAGLTPPTRQSDADRLEAVRRSLRASKRHELRNRKLPIDPIVLGRILSAIEGNDLRAVRDRALLAFAMGGALRRSELVGIAVEHVSVQPDGLGVWIPGSEGFRKSKDAVLIIQNRGPITPVDHYQAWITAACITTGPVFRRVRSGGILGSAALTAQSLALVLKARAAAAGYDPAEYASHSLRAGSLIDASLRGVHFYDVQAQSRLRSLDQVGKYVPRDVHLRGRTSISRN